MASPAASGLQGGNPMLSFFRSMDLFRKIPSDLTEPSLFGGTLSIVSLVVMLLLLVSQITSFLSTSVSTYLLVDRSEDATLLVSFNVSFPHIPCPLLNVDLMDALGHSAHNLSSHGCDIPETAGRWCYVINKYTRVNGHGGIQLVSSSYARRTEGDVAKKGGYKQAKTLDFEGHQPENLIDVHAVTDQDIEDVKADLDINDLIALIDTAREKSGKYEAADPQVVNMERQKLFQVATSLHEWLDDPKNKEDPKYQDVYGNARASIELTKETFQNFINAYPLVLVDFHAPWCPHCRRFDPIWQKAAFVVNQHKFRPGAGGEVHGRAAFVSIDCVAEAELCALEKVQAYPTIRIFRNGRSGLKVRWEEMHDAVSNKTWYQNPVTGQRTWDKPVAMEIDTYEHYQGERSVQALVAFADIALAESLKLKGEDVSAGDLPLLDNVDIDNDGNSESTYVAEGCMVEGFVTTSRAPGSLKFRAMSLDHTLNPLEINMTHTVHSMSFGKQLTPKQVKKLLRYDLGEMERGVKPSINWDWHRDFISNKILLCHEHYMKIVSTTFHYLRGGRLSTYEYTVNSNRLIENSGYDGFPVVPSVNFRFDLSPIQVVLKETQESILNLVTYTCAIIGGVYTVTGLVEATVQSGFMSLKRKLRMGKQF